MVKQKSGLIRKIRLISKFLTSQPEKEIIIIQILPNISKSKENQTMKFGFSWKIIYKTVEKLLPDPAPKDQNWAYFWISTLNFYSLFSFYAKLMKYISCRPLALTSYKVFLKKNKKGLELVFLPLFLHDFWRNKQVWLDADSLKKEKIILTPIWTC